MKLSGGRLGKGAFIHRAVRAYKTELGQGPERVVLALEMWRDGEGCWICLDSTDPAHLKEHLSESPEVDYVYVPCSADMHTGLHATLRDGELLLRSAKLGR